MSVVAHHQSNGHSLVTATAVVRDDASEDASLAAMLLAAANCPDVFKAVTEFDYIVPGNPDVFRAIRAVYEATATTDVTLVRNALADAGRLHKIGRNETPESGVARLAELAMTPVTASNALEYARAVSEAATRRRIDQLGDRFKQRARERDGSGLDELLADLDIDYRGAIEGARIVEPKPAFNLIPAAELATTDYSVEYLIPGIMAEHQPCMIVGPSKGFKTSIGCDAGYSLAAAGYFLGRFKVPVAKRVLFMSGESGLAVLRETFQRICAAAGGRLEDLDNLIVTDTLVRLSDPGNVRELRKVLEDHAIDVWFLDPLYLSLDPNGDEGSMFAMGKLLRAASEVCQEIGVTPVFLHHTKKTLVNPHVPGELGDAAWSVDAFFRQWWIVNRREKYTPGTGLHKLWLSIGGSAGHSGLWAIDVNEGTRQDGAERFWDVELHDPSELQEVNNDERTKAAEQRQEAKLEAAKEKCLKSLAKFPNGETKSVIRDLAGVSGAVVNAVFASLLSDDLVVSCQVIKAGRTTPVEGFKLNEKASV